jgi:hypothetical protein
MAKSKEELLKTYEIGCAMLIFTFNSIVQTPKNFILCNFAAKSLSQLLSVRVLNQCSQVFDCYIIYRSMLDRLSHLFYLGRTNSFAQFEQWSFMEQIKANNNALSDVNMKGRLDKSMFIASEANKKRYKSLQESGVTWKRPKAEIEFKNRGLYFLYNFGYDHASSHVHPMANDGMVEHDIMLNANDRISSQLDYQSKIVIQNAALISSLTFQECLDLSNFKWMALVYDFLENFNKAFADEPNEFQDKFDKMKRVVEQNLPLGQKPT